MKNDISAAVAAPFEDGQSSSPAWDTERASLAFRIKCRVDACVERDGSEEAAIKGRGVGISYLFAKDLHRALSAKSPWRPITDADVGKTMIVTNNINGRNSFGEMSHVWITWIQKADKPEVAGKYVGFDCADRLLHGLSHCAPIPFPTEVDAAIKRTEAQ